MFPKLFFYILDLNFTFLNDCCLIKPNKRYTKSLRIIINVILEFED